MDLDEYRSYRFRVGYGSRRHSKSFDPGFFSNDQLNGFETLALQFGIAVADVLCEEAFGTLLTGLECHFDIHVFLRVANVACAVRTISQARRKTLFAISAIPSPAQLSG